MNRTSRITLGVLLVILILIVGARLRYAGRAPIKLQADSCDAEMWKHVYERDRLRVIQECTAIEGRVMSVHHNADGDVHLALDPNAKLVLNLVNLIRGSGLVAEVVCEHPSSVDAAKAACGGFHPQITIPSVGDRVRVTGAYVNDRDNGWNEVHPVTRIEILR
jgi:hypothetical protein